MIPLLACMLARRLIHPRCRLRFHPHFVCFVPNVRQTTESNPEVDVPKVNATRSRKRKADVAIVSVALHWTLVLFFYVNVGAIAQDHTIFLLLIYIIHCIMLLIHSIYKTQMKKWWK